MHKTLRVAALSAAAFFISVGIWGVTQTGALTSEACRPQADGSIVESGQFTPYEAMRSGPHEFPIDSVGLPADRAPANSVMPPNRLFDMPRQHVVVSGRSLYQYYLDRPLDESMTPSVFAQVGGIQFEREHRTDTTDFASHLSREVGGRAVPVDIGPYRGVVTWADPASNGVRTHNVYWSDGAFEYALIADRSAEALVNAARALVCSGDI